MAVPTARARSSSSSQPLASLLDEAFRRAPGPSRRAGTVPISLLDKRKTHARLRLQDALEARGTEEVPKKLGDQLEELVRRWAEKDFEAGFPEVERFELQCFEEGELAKARRSGEREHMLRAAEKRHRTALLAEYGELELRGLQMSARVYQSLNVVYVPLYLKDESRQAEVIQAAAGVEILGDSRLSVPEVLTRHERVVIVGAPGSGKTTLVAHLATEAAMERLHKSVGAKRRWVPFVVRVHSLGERQVIDEQTIADAIPRCDIDLVRDVLRDGRALVLVDGLDEATGGIANLLPSLQAFAAAYPASRIVATTRPSGPEAAHVEVPGFASTTLLPMTRDEVYQFIDKWCLAAELSIQKDQARAEDEAHRAAEDLKSRVKTSRPVERLAQTPLMCSVLCIVHRFLGQRIPERRAALYEACTNVLLYEWDRTKFKDGSFIGKLDAHHKRFLLSGLAKWMHERHEAEVSASDVIEQFAGRLPEIDRSPDEAAAIVREIQYRSGILFERRPGFFAVCFQRAPWHGHRRQPDTAIHKLFFCRTIDTLLPAHRGRNVGLGRLGEHCDKIASNSFGP
jgi:energy-coupling factor transporter ATP-binding protein EcfA2